jgi:hypothetical protein
MAGSRTALEELYKPSRGASRGAGLARMRSVCLLLACALASAAGHAVRPQQRGWVRAHRSALSPALRMSTAAANSTGEGESEDLSAELRREIEIRPQNSRVWGLKLKGERQERQPSDGRDELPYTLTCLGPPLRELGTFALDHSTQNGDSLFIDNRKYSVKQVTYIYKYTGGRYQMVRKAAACKEQSRITAEEKLMRMYESDSGIPPSDVE